MLESGEFFLLKEDALRIVDEVVKELDKLSIYDENSVFELYSRVHVLKGEAGFFGMMEVADILHSIEDKISQVRDSKVPLPPEVIEDIKKKMLFIRARIASARSSTIDSPQNLKDYVTEFFREYSAVLKKKINFKFEIRGDVALDRYAKIFPDIIHIVVALIRNGVEHATEPEATRISKGKNPIAEIKIDLEFWEDVIRISYSDDGTGFPPDLLEKIKKEGIESVKGLSSKELPTVHSGRGMGLYTIHKIIETRFKNGKFLIESQKDKGTSINISFNL